MKVPCMFIWRELIKLVTKQSSEIFVMARLTIKDVSGGICYNQDRIEKLTAYHLHVCTAKKFLNHSKSSNRNFNGIYDIIERI